MSPCLLATPALVTTALLLGHTDRTTRPGPFGLTSPSLGRLTASWSTFCRPPCSPPLACPVLTGELTDDREKPLGPGWWLDTGTWRGESGSPPTGDHQPCRGPVEQAGALSPRQWPSDRCPECSPHFGGPASLCTRARRQHGPSSPREDRTRRYRENPLEDTALVPGFGCQRWTALGFGASGTCLLKQVIVTLDPWAVPSGCTFMHIHAGAPLQADGDTSGSLDPRWELPLAASVQSSLPFVPCQLGLVYLETRSLLHSGDVAFTSARQRPTLAGSAEHPCNPPSLCLGCPPAVPFVREN